MKVIKSVFFLKKGKKDEKGRLELELGGASLDMNMQESYYFLHVHNYTKVYIIEHVARATPTMCVGTPLLTNTYVVVVLKFKFGSTTYFHTITII